MKKILTFFTILCAFLLIGCNKEKVNTFAFAETEVTVEANKYVQLNLNVKPESSEAWVDWSTSNENVAVLSGGSNSSFSRSIKGVNEGQAVITAKVSGDNSKSATCTVNVYKVAPESIVVTCSKEDSVKISNGEVNLTASEEFTLIPMVMPLNASFRTVTYKSSDESVATVNERGVIHALKVGKTVVTITDFLGLVNKDVVVNVNAIPVESLLLIKQSLEMVADQKYSLSNDYIVRPAIATNTNVIVSSSDKNIVAVINPDTLLAVAPGVATITLTTEDGGKTASLTVTVKETALEGIEVRITKDTINVGEKYDIPVLFTPNNATDKQVTVTSDNTAVVEVIDGLTVRALSAGTANLTLSAGEGEFTAQMEITVVIPVQSVSFDETVKTLSVGEEYILGYSIVPSDATNKEVTLSVANEEVAAIVDAVTIKAMNRGKTVVTITTVDGKKSDTIIVKVE